MLDNWVKVTTIGAAIVIIASAIIAPSIGGIFWLARLDSEVERLESNVKELQDDVAELQADVKQMQINQQLIIEILRELSEDIPKIKADLDALTDHIHGPDGRVRLPPNNR